MFTRFLVYEKRILPTKHFQASQSWHPLSVYGNNIIVQNCLQNEWTLECKVVDFTSIALSIDVACRLRILKTEAVALWAADATRRLNIMAFVTVTSYKPNERSYKLEFGIYFLEYFVYICYDGFRSRDPTKDRKLRLSGRLIEKRSLK